MYVDCDYGVAPVYSRDLEKIHPELQGQRKRGSDHSANDRIAGERLDLSTSIGVIGPDLIEQIWFYASNFSEVVSQQFLLTTQHCCPRADAMCRHCMLRQDRALASAQVHSCPGQRNCKSGYCKCVCRCVQHSGWYCQKIGPRALSSMQLLWLSAMSLCDWRWLRFGGSFTHAPAAQLLRRR